MNKVSRYAVIILFAVMMLTSLIALVLPPTEAHALTDPHGNTVICYNSDLNEVPCNHSSVLTRATFDSVTGELIPDDFDINGAEITPANVTGSVVDPEPRVTQDALDKEAKKAEEVLADKKPESQLTAKQILSNRDVEDVALAPPAPIPEIDDQLCGQTHLTNVVLPFTMTVKYPQTLNADVIISANSPQVSEMKKIQDSDFFTIDTKNSTDVFAVSAHWQYDSKPRGLQFISYEVYSDNQRVQQSAISFDSLEYCHLFSIETELKTHVPTLEEFQKENDIQINNAFEVVAMQMVNNNDLTFILVLVVIGSVLVIIMLIAILLYVNRDIAKSAEESEDRINVSNNKVMELYSGMKVLARSDIAKNEKVRDSFISAFSLCSNNINNIVIDLKNILHATLRDNPKAQEVHLKSEASKEPEEIERIINAKKHSEPKKKLFGLITPKDKPEPGAEYSIETFMKRYADETKYPTSKLSIRDESLRRQYMKSPTEKISNEINAISSIIGKRIGA